MKEILKKAIIPIFLSVICGCVCGKLVYKIYLGNNDLAYDGNLIYLVQSGAYSSYDSMRTNTTSYDYVYYEEDDMFKTVIGVTKNEKNIEKITDLFEGEVIINQYYVEDQNLNSEIIKFDNMLLEENDSEKIREIVIKMLNLYKGEVDTKLIKIS